MSGTCKRFLNKMKGRMRFAVHPLFLLFGIYYACTGRLFLFLVSTLVAVMHEFGHAVAAARVGYRLDRVVLMPYGALISGDIEGIGLKDEIIIALAGPLVNAVTAVMFVALWWFFPETYAYTDVAAYSSAAIAAVNLLPAYPLDGGRILYCAAAKWKGERFAAKLARGAGLLFSAALFALFLYGCFCVTVNFTLAFFAAFLLAGALGGRERTYLRIRADYSREMKKGLEVRRVAVRSDCTVKKLLSFLQRGKYAEFIVYGGNGEFICELSEEEFSEILENADLYSPIGTYILQK